MATVVFSLGAVVLSCVIVDGWRTSPLLGVWAVGTAMRWKVRDRQVGTDAVVFCGAVLWSMRKELGVAVNEAWEEVDGVVGSWLPVVTRLMIPVALASILLTSYAHRETAPVVTLPKGLSRWNSHYPKPRIFPCQTKHARMFPKRHAFEYSYLQCGFPIIPAGVTQDGEAVGGSHDRQLGRWWLRIRAEDYLTRGHGELGFYGKLKMYLRGEGVDDSEWSYAYLVTAPRFLGYAFNPVSFWYVYDGDQQLKKMVLEVNNTFGERRMYLLGGYSVPSPPSTPESEVSGAELPAGAKARFTDLWMKDFHVSPFNSRKGSYALKTLNPFPFAQYDRPMIDNTITLKSSKDHAKLVARLCSTGAAIDPDDLGTIGALRFVLSWWWVGLVTFPRILREAFKIFFKRGLHVWFRPEVLQSSVGRLPSSTEVELYHIFKDYLDHLVRDAQHPLRVTFHSAIPDEPVQRIEIPPEFGIGQVTRDLEIRVLTPAFYSRFVHYAHTSEAFDRECIFTDEKNRTVWVSRPEYLDVLFSDLQNKDTGVLERNSFDELRWKVLMKLRCPPAEAAYPVNTPSKAEFTLEDVRALSLSPLDRFVRDHQNPAYAGSYRRIAIKLFLAQRFSFGFPEIIGLVDLMIRILLCAVGALCLQGWRSQRFETHLQACLQDTIRTGSWNSSMAGSTNTSVWVWLIGTTLAVSSCNMYQQLKGYQ